MQNSPLSQIPCAAPFAQMTLKPDGKVALCCYQYHVEVGDLKTQTLAEVWNGKKLQKIRLAFLEDRHSFCKTKMKNTKCHETFNDFLPECTPDIVQSVPPRKLDVRLNSRCNLKCVMCDVYSGPNGVFDATSFWREGPDSIFPFLREIEILGGEPFIQQDTFKLIDAVLASNPSCRFSFVTNGQYPISARLQRYLSAISLKKILVSVDSLDAKTYGEIRKQGDHALLMTNLVYFHALQQSTQGTSHEFVLSAGMCVLKNNCLEIPAFFAFCREREIVPELQFVHYDPSGQSSVKYFNQTEKDALIMHLHSVCKPEDRVFLAPILAALDTVKSSLSWQAGNKGLLAEGRSAIF